jgi:hypothetical protein
VEFVDLFTLMKDPPPPVGNLWGDDKVSLIPCKGLTLLHSGSKMGKSLMLKGLALAGARGDKEFLGIKINGPFTTLIFQGEIHLRGVYERFDIMLQGALEKGEVTEEQLRRIWINVKREERLSEDAAFYEFQKAVRILRPDFIGLDPLAHVLTTNENDNAVVGAMLEKLATLRDDPGAAILLVHHDSKTTEATALRSPQQRARGADRLNADPDCILSLVPGVRTPTGPTGTLHVASRYGRSVAPLSLKLNEDILWFEENLEEGSTKQIALWISQSGCDTVEESSLIEMVENGWNLHDPKQHRSARKSIKAAMMEDRIVQTELDGKLWYSVKEE